MRTGLLPYDLAVLFQGQAAGRATIQRDYGQPDAYGGEGKPDWQTLTTVECVLVWNKATGSRSSNETYVTPARRVPVSEGFVIVPSGTDVTEEDRLSQIAFNDGTVIDGLFVITAIIDPSTHLELYLERSHVGA